MVRPRLAALVGLLALVPVALFYLGRDVVALVLAAASVLLVVASLWVMFGDAETGVADVGS